MRRWASFLKQLATESRGATAVEYAMILAMVVLAMFGALATVGGDTATMWNNIASKVTNAH